MTDFETAQQNAQQAQNLRETFRGIAHNAVTYAHINMDWVNASLAALGIQPIGGKAEYRMKVAITGAYGWRVKAGSRAEAMEQFKRNVARVASAGKIVADGSYDNVYDLEVVGEPEFYAGPEDPEVTDPDSFTLDELKAGIRDMLKEGVRLHGWGHSYAVEAAEQLGLESLPSLVTKTVEVPVSGVYKTTVQMFADDGDEAVQERVKAVMAAVEMVPVKAEEVGPVQVKADEYEEPAEDDVF